MPCKHAKSSNPSALQTIVHQALCPWILQWISRSFRHALWVIFLSPGIRTRAFTFPYWQAGSLLPQHHSGAQIRTSAIVAQLRPPLCTLWAIARQGSSSMVSTKHLEWAAIPLRDPPNPIRFLQMIDSLMVTNLESLLFKYLLYQNFRIIMSNCLKLSQFIYLNDI